MSIKRLEGTAARNGPRRTPRAAAGQRPLSRNVSRPPNMREES